MQNNNEIKLHFTEIFTNENGKKGIKHPDGRMESTMDADAWHDLLLECICDQYNDLD